MNTHKHTPGPWSVETKGSRHFIDGADELTVAYVDRAGVRERQTYEANARLICAAPDLLAALREIESKLTALLCERVLDSTLPEFYEVRDARNSARAAISKAEAIA
jgi:YD repeat-containing protein